MWGLNSVFLFLLLNFLTINNPGTTIWEEEFNTPEIGFWGDPDGTTIHNSLPASTEWLLDAEACSFTSDRDYVKTVSTSGGRLEALDCDGEAVWQSPWISISSYAAVHCELIAKETGSGNKPERKYVEAFYQLDQEEKKLFETNGLSQGNWGESVVSQSQLQGDSIRLIVRLNSSYASDKVIVDAIRVWSDEPEKVDPNQQAKTGDLLINEVLFNPFDEGVDFVEIYNQSAKEIRLDHLFLANRDDQQNLKTIVQLSSESILLPSKTYLAVSENQEQVLNFYSSTCASCFLDVTKMPALNNSSGEVVLLNDSMQVIDEMHYTEKMHHPLLIEEEGISLERISFEESALEPSNWTSGKNGHQLASPGFENAMSANSLVKNTRLQLEPEAFSPNEDGYNDLLQINYQLDKVGYLANLRIFNSNGVQINHLVRNEPTAIQGLWIWDGKQTNGSRSPIGLYIILLELLHPDGSAKQFKKVCTLTDRIY